MFIPVSDLGGRNYRGQRWFRDGPGDRMGRRSNHALGNAMTQTAFYRLGSINAAA